MLPLKRRMPASSIAELALEVARHQLVGDRGAHVVGDDEDGPPVAVAADQLLGQVGLPEEAVVVVARLVGEAEAEEVEGEHVALAAPRSSSSRQS